MRWTRGELKPAFCITAIHFFRVATKLQHSENPFSMCFTPKKKEIMISVGHGFRVNSCQILPRAAIHSAKLLVFARPWTRAGLFYQHKASRLA